MFLPRSLVLLPATLAFCPIAAAQLAFQSSYTQVTSTNPRALATGDLNGDAVPDVAAVTITGDVLVLLNRPFGLSFAGPVGRASTPSVSIALGDLTGDGICFAPCPIPNQPRLSGASFHCQGLWLASRAQGDGCSSSPANLVSSRGVSFTLQ